MPFLRFISHPAAAIFLLLTLAACSDSDKNAVPKNAAVPVTTAISHEADTPVIIEATGRVEASETVGIRARVSGTLE
ncbi:MAG TPA: hypothetical protein DEB25_08900, partial [Desulfobulbaceae bacterium]|nr:hypothetical protein [Desulfobulbaceae bacterium]